MHSASNVPSEPGTDEPGLDLLTAGLGKEAISDRSFLPCPRPADGLSDQRLSLVVVQHREDLLEPLGGGRRRDRRLVGLNLAKGRILANL